MTTTLWSTPEHALAATSLLIAVASVTASAEWLALWRRTGPTTLIAPVPGDTRRLESQTWSIIVRVLHGVRVAAGLWILAVVMLGMGGVPVWGILLVAGCCVLLRLPVLRLRAGMDGAEALVTAVSLALAVAAVAGDDETRRVALVLVALLVSMEYVGAGLWKASDLRQWANGANLRRVLRSRYYGSPTLTRAVATDGHDAQWLLAAASVGAVALEVSAPLALVLPLPWAVGLLIVMLGFHIANAAVMGLNTFVSAYAATYPAVLYTNHLIHGTAWS